MADTTKLHALADLIKLAVDEPFDMNSPAECIMRYVRIQAGDRSMMASAALAHWLGMNDDERRELFFPSYVAEDDEGHRADALDVITRDDAVAVIHRFADTGKIDWAWRLPTLERW